MKSSQKLTLIALVVFALAGLIGLILSTTSSPPQLESNDSQDAGVANLTLDHQYLDTARALSGLAVTAQEQQVAQDAIHIANQEMDKEFAAALQIAGSENYAQTPEVKDIRARIATIQTAIESKQNDVTLLTDKVKNARVSQRDMLQQQLDVGQAELNFYKERLEDAKDDLVHAGGDPHSVIQQLVDEHEAASHAADSVKFAPASPTLPAASSLLAKWSQWNAIRRKQKQVAQAQQDALSAADKLTLQHGPLAHQVDIEQAQRKAPTGTVATAENSINSGKAPTDAKQAALAAVSLLQRLSNDRRALVLLDRRVRDFKTLGSTYGKWLVLVRADQREALHDIIGSALSIVLLMLLVFLINRTLEHFFARLSLETKQRATLQAVIRISIQVLTVLVVLVIIFGAPNDVSTVLGFAGAGLTVVLKDFIVSFLGWFVLVGRHGIRVGDWVEINGVRGEVIEITLLRTVLLETGNWTESGQPTGRQVAFLNQYAVDGYYFNFSTSGQWLWDELQVLLPTARDPYPLIEKLRVIVEKDTESNTHLADQEWQGVSRRYGVRTFAAEPTVNLKPTDAGTVVMIRYITRVEERSEVRYRINQEVIKLLHGGAEDAPPTEAPNPLAPSTPKPIPAPSK
jgi:small-conductance mechanosensitive channel